MKSLAVTALFFYLLLANNLYAAEQQAYSCPVDQVYKTGAGRSIDMDGGELDVLIQDGEITLANSRINGFGSHHLKVIKNTGIEIKGRNESMIFVYHKVSHEFVLHTGIGPSGFSYSGNGHTGKQMRVSGKCSIK